MAQRRATSSDREPTQPHSLQEPNYSTTLRASAARYVEHRQLGLFRFAEDLLVAELTLLPHPPEEFGVGCKLIWAGSSRSFIRTISVGRPQFRRRSRGPDHVLFPFWRPPAQPNLDRLRTPHKLSCEQRIFQF